MNKKFLESGWNSQWVTGKRSGMLGDLQNVGILLAGQLPNRNILPSPKLPVRAHVSVGWEGRESHPRLALNSEFVKVLAVVVQSCPTCATPWITAHQA